MEFLNFLGFCLLIGASNADPSMDLDFFDFNEPLHNTFPSQTIEEILPKISNGHEAHVGQFPWHASLAIKYRDQDPKANSSYCSGAILNENWIITTADCIANAQAMRVDLGTVEINKPAVSVYPDAFTVHPKYVRGKFDYNLGLLRLSGPNVLIFTNEPTPNFAPIRLPQRRQEHETFGGYETYFSGFGDKSPQNHMMSETLLYTEGRVIPNTACVGFFSNNMELINPKVTCTMSVNMHDGACVGDAGAPLVINEYGTNTLVGLLSFLHITGNCGQSPVPAVFTRITSHFDWISRVTNYQIRP